MVCEGLFRLYGTNSKEFIERTKEEAKKKDAEFYQPKIDAISSEIDYLKNLLTRHNISYNSET